MTFPDGVRVYNLMPEVSFGIQRSPTVQHDSTCLNNSGFSGFSLAFLMMNHLSNGSSGILTSTTPPLLTNPHRIDPRTQLHGLVEFFDSLLCSKKYFLCEQRRLDVGPDVGTTWQRTLQALEG